MASIDAELASRSLATIYQWETDWKNRGTDVYTQRSTNGNNGLDAALAANNVSLPQFNGMATALGIAFTDGEGWIRTLRDQLTRVLSGQSPTVSAVDPVTGHTITYTAGTFGPITNPVATSLLGNMLPGLLIGGGLGIALYMLGSLLED